MAFLSGCFWSSGKCRGVNQDSLFVSHLQTGKGECLFACICDGMGGHEEGETASGYAAEQAAEWLFQEGADLIRTGAGIGRWRRAAYRLVYRVNSELLEYGERKGISLGTTFTGVLISKGYYYVVHIGDSRLYEIRESKWLGKARMRKVTKDHASAADVLYKCIGITEESKPDVYRLRRRRHTGILLCSDGFYRRIREEELLKALLPSELREEAQIERRLKEIGERCMQRGEKDNLSGVYIKLDMNTTDRCVP